MSTVIYDVMLQRIGDLGSEVNESSDRDSYV